MSEQLSTGQAANLLGMAGKALREAAHSGLINFVWSTTSFGQPVHVFERDAVERYRSQRIASLRAQLAKLEAAAG